MNSIIEMTENVEIQVGDGIDGPLYDPNARVISIPTSFVTDTEDVFASAGDPVSEEEGVPLVADVVQFVTIHEIGHALIDVFGLEVPGNEEDSVDTLAAVMMVDNVEAGADIALAAADWFSALDAITDPAEKEEVAFTDEHSLDIDRAYNILCLVYGSDIDTNAALAAELPPPAGHHGIRWPAGRDRCRAVNRC